MYSSIEVKQKIIEQINLLPAEYQIKVLDFARELAQSLPGGTPGKDLLQFAGIITEKDAQLINNIVNEECGRINADEW